MNLHSWLAAQFSVIDPNNADIMATVWSRLVQMPWIGGNPVALTSVEVTGASFVRSALEQAMAPHTSMRLQHVTQTMVVPENKIVIMEEYRDVGVPVHLTCVNGEAPAGFDGFPVIGSGSMLVDQSLAQFALENLGQFHDAYLRSDPTKTTLEEVFNVTPWVHTLDS